jgi:two-component system chemotaxis response regulator CheY
MPDLKVLVVDDSSTMRRIIKNSLTRLEFADIVEAADGSEAVGKADGCNLVITDWNMPEMNGLELVKSLRSSDSHKETPIIMVTTEAGKNEIVEAIQNGVNNYIVKPFTIDVLKEKLEAVLKTKLKDV